VQGRTRDGAGRGWLARSCRLAIWLVIATAITCHAADAAEAPVAADANPVFRAFPGAAYEVRFSGNARDTAGATVCLASKGDDVKPFGSATTSIDGAPFRYHRLRLSADLTTHDATDGAALWLRADAAKKSRAFMNSQADPVNDGTGSGHRQVEIDVPGDVDRIVFGVLLMKHGELTASRLILEDLGEEQSSPFAGPTLAAAIDIVRKNAYHSRDVDWSSVEPEVRELAGTAGRLSDTHAAIKRLLKALNDHHSFWMDAARAASYRHNGQSSAAATVEPRGADLGYISMPGFMGTDAKLVTDFAAPLAKAIVDLSPRCGWIVDLRNDNGGNMYPMLAALRPLLGASPAGAFEQADGRVVPWIVPGSATVDQSAARVAVLTGPRTASSGEAVTVAFRGRPSTRSFGAGTTGLSSGNQFFPLPDGSEIGLMTTIDRDRDGHRYGGVVEPDEPVDDATAEASAAAWLRGTCQPAASPSGK
jgi:peptidase S41-like protein